MLATDSSGNFQSTQLSPDTADTLFFPLQSLRCADCGKVFRNTVEAQWHGEKSGHSNFEESTEEKAPLTEEEKQQK